MGTRGSIASPGPDTVRFGGKTPCVEMMAAGHRLIFDAGTGIRALGDELVAAGERKEATIFLTHFHVDHVQGLPFFAPAWNEGSEIHVVGPAQRGPDGEEVGVKRLAEGRTFGICAAREREVIVVGGSGMEVADDV
jgi:phosphoribosyl 1,2-cyclic phosphodiesterase